jgi:hypothetical protein
MKNPTDNPIAGTGQHSHRVPAIVGLVVEIRDGNHAGTSIWRRDDDRLPYVFVSHDKLQVGYAERCVLVRGLDVEEIPYEYLYGCDLSTPDGVVLLGLDAIECVDDLDWLKGEILWDSALEAEYEAAAEAVLAGEALGNPVDIVHMVRRAKARKE